MDRWYPSSKICSQCGYTMPKMPIAMRKWTCPQCQTHHDGDINTAMNWQKAAESSVRSSSPPSV